MTNAVRTTVTEALAALDEARKELETAETAELESSAWVDSEREYVATGDTGRRSDLTRARNQLARDQERRLMAEAAVRKRERDLEATREAALTATRAEFVAARDALAAAYEARRAGVRSLSEDLAKLLAAAKASLDDLADETERIGREFGERGVTWSLPRIRRLDADPHLWKRLNDAIQALYGEYR